MIYKTPEHEELDVMSSSHTLFYSASLLLPLFSPLIFTSAALSDSESFIIEVDVWPLSVDVSTAGERA